MANGLINVTGLLSSNMIIYITVFYATKYIVLYQCECNKNQRTFTEKFWCRFTHLSLHEILSRKTEIYKAYSIILCFIYNFEKKNCVEDNWNYI